MTEEQYLKWADFIIKHFQKNREQDNNIEYGIEEALELLGCDYRGWDYKNIIDNFIEQGLVIQTGNGLQLKTKGILCKGFVPILIKDPETATTIDICEALITILYSEKRQLHINEILERMGNVNDNITSQAINRLEKEDFIYKKVLDVTGTPFTFYFPSLNGIDIIKQYKSYAGYQLYLKAKSDIKEKYEQMEKDLIQANHDNIDLERQLKVINLIKSYWWVLTILFGFGMTIGWLFF